MCTALKADPFWNIFRSVMVCVQYALEDVRPFKSGVHHLSQSELNNCITQARSTPVCSITSASSWFHPIINNSWEAKLLYNKCSRMSVFRNVRIASVQFVVFKEQTKYTSHWLYNIYSTYISPHIHNILYFYAAVCTHSRMFNHKFIVPVFHSKLLLYDC